MHPVFCLFGDHVLLCWSGELQNMSWMSFTETKMKLNMNSRRNITVTNKSMIVLGPFKILTQRPQNFLECSGGGGEWSWDILKGTAMESPDKLKIWYKITLQNTQLSKTKKIKSWINIFSLNNYLRTTVKLPKWLSSHKHNFPILRSQERHTYTSGTVKLA